MKGNCVIANHSIMSTTIKIILDVRRMKESSQKYPIKLKVCFQRKTRLYQTVFELSQEEFKKLESPNINTDLRFVRDNLKSIQKSAEEFILGRQVFGFEDFERRYVTSNKLIKTRKRLADQQEILPVDSFDYTPYYKHFPILLEKPSRPGTIQPVYSAYIRMLLQEERIGSAGKYQDSYTSIKKFSGDCLFIDITKSFLIRFEQWMLKQGRSKTTVGIKLRCLRAIFNEANEMRIIRKDDCYPFGRRRYRIPTGRNIKKALNLDEIKAIYDYKPQTVLEDKAKDFWLFCYFSNGMNPKDVAFLKFKNIQDGFLVFSRAKTEGTTRHDPRIISVYITDDMKRIIAKWGNKSKKLDNYLFPIMEANLTPLQQFKIVPAFTQFINDKMEVIGKNLGIERKITTIVSRHSFSTQMKRSGASTEYIQEALGHMDKKTTENYLGSFGNEVKKEFANALTAF